MDIAGLIPSFRRAMLASNKASGTVNVYCNAVSNLASYLVDEGVTREPTRDDINKWMERELGRHAASTARRDYRGVQQFFKWAVDEEEVKRNPMERTKAPVVIEQPSVVLTDEQLGDIVRACEGKRFQDRRDMAIVRLLFDTGMRREECASIRLEKLDLDQNLVRVTGKGRRERDCPFGRRTALALDRYLRARNDRQEKNDSHLWLGIRGPLTGAGVYNIVTKRAKKAGIPDDMHPHIFRHTFAHRWLQAGGQEVDLMRLAGWRSRTMVSRYAASTADERARDAHMKFALGDKV
jgi:site-specific recombinase XerD